MSTRQYVSIGLDNGLVSNRGQAIIWTNDGLLYWRTYVSLDLNGLISWAGGKYLTIHIYHVTVLVANYGISNTLVLEIP